MLVIDSLKQTYWSCLKTPSLYSSRHITGNNEIFYAGYALRRSISQGDAPEYKVEALLLLSLLDSVSFLLPVLKE